MIDADAVFEIVVDDALAVAEESGGVRGGGDSLGQELLEDGAESGGGNGVVGEGLIGVGGVADDDEIALAGEESGEVAAALGVGEDAGGKGVGALADVRILEAAEEEGFVFEDGSTEGAAVLVAFETVVGAATGDGVKGGEKVAGVETVVAEEPVGAAVEVIGAGAGGDVDDAAGAATVFGGVAVGLDTDFLDEVGVGEGVGDGAVGVHVVAAIHEVVDAVGFAAADGNGDLIGGLEGGADVLADGDDAGGDGDELEGVAPIEGELDHAGVVDDVAEDGVGGIDGGGLAADLDDFGGGTDREGGIDPEALVDLEFDAGLAEALEAFGFDVEGVGTNGKGGESEEAGGVRRAGADDAGLFMADADLRGRDGGAAGVRNGAGEATGALGEGGEREQIEDSVHERLLRGSVLRKTIPIYGGSYRLRSCMSMG